MSAHFSYWPLLLEDASSLVLFGNHLQGHVFGCYQTFKNVPSNFLTRTDLNRWDRDFSFTNYLESLDFSAFYTVYVEPRSYPTVIPLSYRLDWSIWRQGMPLLMNKSFLFFNRGVTSFGLASFMLLEWRNIKKYMTVGKPLKLSSIWNVAGRYSSIRLGARS